jgi:uncharacterized protein (DUF2267 family)
MTTTGISSFDSTVIKTKNWLKHLQEHLHLDDEEQAYVTLRAVLHALRDRLSPDMAAKLGSQMPMLVRGIYYEGWHPGNKPLKIRDQQEFLDHVTQSLGRNMVPKLSNPIRLTEAVFKLLDSQLTEGEIESVKRTLPQQVRKLWP